MSYSYTRRVPTVPTYNGVGGGPIATQRITAWKIPVKSPYDGVGDFDDFVQPSADWETIKGRVADLFGGGGGDVEGGDSQPVDMTAPPKGGSAPAPATPPAAAPPKVQPTGPATVAPNVLAAPPKPAASSGGLSTMALVGGGVATLAIVGGLVYWKKSKKGGRR